ncbi:MAG: hypothetical protein K6V36_10125 [Anaerolineae bacterium]|nr:hypothetical protein [Anaerolineae bacterium]
MAETGSPRPAPLVNSLLGMVLILVAALDLLMLAMIGWAVWRRSTLAEVRFRMHQEDVTQLQDPQKEALALREMIALARESISGTLEAIPTDTDVARYVSGLRAHAWGTGVSIVELDVRPSIAGGIPVRRYGVRVQGEWSRLTQFLTRVAETCPSTARVEQLTLRQGPSHSELSFELVVAVRPEAQPTSRRGARLALLSLAPRVGGASGDG